MRIAILFIYIREAVRIKMDGVQPLRIDISLIFITQDQAENAAFRIRVIHIENILMTVQGHHSQLIVIIRKNDPWNIAVRFHRNFQFLRIFRRHVIRVQRHFRILLASFRIFIVIIAGIKPVAEHLHRIFGHFRFIETHKSQLFAVRRPGHQVRYGKLFFIYPIGNTVQDFIQLPVFRHLDFRIVIEFTNPYIIVTHIGDHPPVRRECRNHLLAFRIGNRLHIITAHIIVVHIRLERTAIDRLRIAPDENMMSCAADRVSVELVKRTLTRFPCIE